MITPEQLSEWSGFLHQMANAMKGNHAFIPTDRLKTNSIAEGIYTLHSLLQSNLTRTYPTPSVVGCQHQEYDLFDKYLPSEPSTYVDIGAGAPVDCSNTWHLYERGWRGLLIEPLFWFWPSLQHHRRGDYLVGSAIRNYTGKTLLSVQGSVSSVIPSWTVDNVCQMVVDCELGRDILEQFATIRNSCQFCSIDVEGIESEVIESIDWSLFKPKVVCVEYMTYSPEESKAKDLSDLWQPRLLDCGYELVDKTQLNKIFVRT